MDALVIAKRLIEIRGNESREYVAKKLNISLSAVQMYENAARIPRDEIKMKYAKYAGKSVDEIFFKP